MNKKYLRETVYFISLLVGLSIYFIPLSVFASTNIASSTITGTVNWNVEGSPYIISSNLYIEPGASLELAPGTIVKFAPGAGITVGGNLQAVGTKSKGIIFTSLNDKIGGHTGNDRPLPNDWSGIAVISSPDKVSFKNVDLRYALEPIFLSSSNANFQNVSVSSSSAVASIYNSTLTVDGGHFQNILRTAFSAYGTSTLTVSSSSFNHLTGEAFSVFDNSYLTFLNSTADDIENASFLSLYKESQAIIGSSTLSNINAGVYTDPIAVFADSALSISNSVIRNVSGNAAINVYNNHQEGSGLTLSHSILDGGTGDGILTYDNLSINISSSTIMNFINNGIEEFSGGGVVMDNSIIQNNRVGMSFNDPSITISTSSIKDNLDSGIIYNGGPVLTAKNVWWGDSRGPTVGNTDPIKKGDKILGNINFDPWLFKDPFAKFATTSGSNVIFLPGLEGSRLYTKGTFTENQLWEPNIDGDGQKLFLDNQGKSLDGSIYTRDIINKTNIIPLGLFAQGIYQSFTDSMNQLVENHQINDWEPIPYDWREDYNNIIANGIKLSNGQILSLVDEVVRMASSSKTSQVSLVTHSNGGLVAKGLINYLQSIGKSNLVDKLIMVAPPQLGTPEALSALLHGDDQDIKVSVFPLLSQVTARSLSLNMPSAYDLLPGGEYLKEKISTIVKFDSSVDKASNLKKVYGSSINSTSSLDAFLLALKDKRLSPNGADLVTPNVLNSLLVEKGNADRNFLDSWTPPPNLQVTDLAGWGISTTNGLQYFSKEKCVLGIINCSYILDHQALTTNDGDGTVVSPSALFGEGAKYYLNINQYNVENNANSRHGNILEIPATLSLIDKVIMNSSSTLPSYISFSKPTKLISSQKVKVNSVARLSAKDSLGNRTGIVEIITATDTPPEASSTLFIQEDIPNSSYQQSDDEQVLNVNPGNYTIELQGTDLGNMSISSNDFEGDVEVSSSTFPDIPVTSSTTAELIISSASSSSVQTLFVDVDGDGAIDATMTPMTVSDPSYYLVLMKKIVAGFNIDETKKANILSRMDKVIKLIAKKPSSDVATKMDLFKKRLENRKAKHPRVGEKISAEEIQSLIDLLNQLLDSLSP